LGNGIESADARGCCGSQGVGASLSGMRDAAAVLPALFGALAVGVDIGLPAFLVCSVNALTVIVRLV